MHTLYKLNPQEKETPSAPETRPILSPFRTAWQEVWYAMPYLVLLSIIIALSVDLVIVYQAQESAARMTSWHPGVIGGRTGR